MDIHNQINGMLVLPIVVLLQLIVSSTSVAQEPYKDFVLQAKTGLHPTNEEWEFTMAPNRDLVAVNRKGAGQPSATEIHILKSPQQPNDPDDNRTVGSGCPAGQTHVYIGGPGCSPTVPSCYRCR